MKKLLSPSNILACISFILALVFVILYAVNVSAEGYFQGIKAQNVVLFAILAMVFDLLVIVLPLLPAQGIAGKILGICGSVCKVLVPVFLVLGALNLLGARLEGLGYIYFSNVDVAKEVATPANLASASIAISAISTGLGSAIVSIVGSFFSPRVREAEKQPVVE